MAGENADRSARPAVERTRHVDPPGGRRPGVSLDVERRIYRLMGIVKARLCRSSHERRRRVAVPANGRVGRQRRAARWYDSSRAQRRTERVVVLAASCRCEETSEHV